MRTRLGLLALPLGVLLLAGCNGSTETGTETQPKVDSNAPDYTVVSQDADEDGGTDFTVSVRSPIDDVSTQSLAAELLDDNGDDGVYALTVVCQYDEDSQLATARWAVGEQAQEETGLAEGIFDTSAEPDQSCGDRPT